MAEYTISYARFLLRSWGFTRKVPVGRHVKRASRQKIAWFRKKLGPLIEERTRAGYTACVQDEAICMANARLRKGIYTPKGVRGVYTYTGSHSKTIVFGLITLDGEGFFQRYGSFTGKEFVEFLKAACERFGKILMITDGAPQHRSKFVREEIGRLDGVGLHSGSHKDPTSWHQNTATVLHCQRSPVSRRPVSGENKTAAVEGLQTGIILRRGHPQETS